MGNKTAFFGDGANYAYNKIKDHAFAHYMSKLRVPVLLFGPTGCGKSLVAQKILLKGNDHNSKCVKPVDIISKSSQNCVACVEKLFRDCKTHNPFVLFFEDFESIFIGDDDRVNGLKEEFNKQLQTLSENFLFIAASNQPWKIPLDVRKCFGFKFYLPNPNEDERKKFLEYHLKQVGYKLTDKDYKNFAASSDGFSFRDLDSVFTTHIAAVVDLKIESGDLFRDELRKGKVFHIPCETKKQIDDRSHGVITEAVLEEEKSTVTPEPSVRVLGNGGGLRTSPHQLENESERDYFSFAITFKIVESALRRVVPQVSEEELKLFKTFV